MWDGWLALLQCLFLVCIILLENNWYNKKPAHLQLEHLCLQYCPGFRLMSPLPIE